MAPRPETPEPNDGRGSDDDTPSGLDPTASDIVVQPATTRLAATPPRRNRSANATRNNDPATSSSSPHLPTTGAFPTGQDLASRYGPSSTASLRRHVLSPAGGGRVVRRPVVERSLTRLCTLALPPLGGISTEDVLNESAAAGGAADAPPAGSMGNASVADDPARTGGRQRSTSGTSVSAGDAAAIAAAAAALTSDESDGRSISSRLSLATGTTAPVTNTGSSVANTTAVESSAHDQNQQLEASFPPARPNFAPGCQPLIAFGRYVVVATDDGRVCLFMARCFQENVDIFDQIDEKNEEEGEDWDSLELMKERINRIEDGRSAVGPVATVGPFRVGGGLMAKGGVTSTGSGDEFDLPGCIVALAATPAHVPLPTYRKRKKRRRTGDAEDDGDEDHIPPPPKAGHAFMGHIVALTSEGDVHIIQVYESDDGPKRNSRPLVEVLASFSTMTFCATCICIRQSHGQVDSDGASGPVMRVCVGHDNGVIGEWEVIITCDTPFMGTAGGIRRPTLAPGQSGPETKEESAIPSSAPSPGHEFSANGSNLDSSSPSTTTTVDAVSAAAGALGVQCEDGQNESNEATADSVDNEQKFQRTPQPPELLQSPPLKYSIPRPRLIWAGQLDAPIRSLSSLGDTARSEDADLVSFQQTHVAIGLVQRTKPPHQNPIPVTSSSLPPSLAIEVINADRAESEWQKVRSTRNDMSPRSSGLDPVPLFDMCTWPGIGMEIRDGSSIFDLQSANRSEYMASRIDDNMVRGACLGLQNSPGFAIAVSDGTVAVSHIIKQSSGLPAWGISSNHSQIFLPGPPIGMGCFSGDGEGPSLAYCLQGGLLFVVRADESLSASAGSFPQIIFYQYPFDPEGEGDDIVRFTHGFIAGNAIVSDCGANGVIKEDVLPIVGFSWAGGVMDLFGCVGCVGV